MAITTESFAMPGSLVVASRRFYWILGLSIAINLFLFAQYYRVSYNVPELPPVPQTS